MALGRKKQERIAKQWNSLPQQSSKIVLAMLVASILFHVGSAYKLIDLHSTYGDDKSSIKTPDPVKMKIVERTKQQEEDLKQILEAKQTPTEKPDAPKFLGHEDHKAKKETKVAEEDIRNKKGADAGKQGERTANSRERKRRDLKKGQVLIGQHKPRNAYEKMLPIGTRDLEGLVKAGYQDYIDEKIAEGDRIDIDTAKYRYLGYFINMRKSIQLVWNYPLEAARKGLKGEVGLEFALAKDGSASRIKVIKTSGYGILDDAIVEAIKLASPFSPLPDGFEKDRIVITGSFRYVLGRSYGTH